MNFMEAIKEMEKGHIMELPDGCIGTKFRIEPEHRGLIEMDCKTKDGMKWVIADMQLCYINENWEIVKEKKTLSDKAIDSMEDYDDALFIKDVKEALKNVTNWLVEKQSGEITPMMVALVLEEEFGKRLIK